MEPVERSRRIGEGLTDRGQEGRWHVADDFGDLARLAIVLGQEVFEPADSFLALARRGEHHGPGPAIQIDEDGDVVVPPLRSRLVKRHGLQIGKDRKSTRLNSSHYCASRMPSSACKNTEKTSV